ncbi:MAG: hypothetical protein V1725_08195 [archaeon]
MENLINASVLVRNEPLLRERLFTDIQFAILKKRLGHKPLNSTERTYYYKFIKPKIKAMMAFFNITDLNIQGEEHIVQGRKEEAITILKRLEKKHKNKKILISGSFLFNKEYADIDAFVITTYTKEDYVMGRLHVTFLPESSLDSLFFQSIAQISVSNFIHARIAAPRMKLEHLLQVYELLINAVLNTEEHEKELREFILQTEYYSRGVVLNPKQLYALKEKLARKNTRALANTLINALLLEYTNDVERKLKQHIADYKKLLRQYKTAKNLPIYIDTYEQVMSLAT